MPYDHEYYGVNNTREKVINSSDWFQIKIELPGRPHWEGNSWAKVCLGWFVPRKIREDHLLGALLTMTKSLLSPFYLHCSSFRSWPQAQGMPRTPRMYLCQPSASDTTCPTTDGYFGKFTSIYDTTGSWEEKQELFSPSLKSQSVVKSPALIQ